MSVEAVTKLAHPHLDRRRRSPLALIASFAASAIATALIATTAGGSAQAALQTYQVFQPGPGCHVDTTHYPIRYSGCGRVGLVAGSSVNVRLGPSTSRGRIATLARGTKVYISCQSPGQRVTGPRARNWPWWDRITSPVTGWISDAYIDSGRAARVAPDCPSGTPGI
jgi:hypothetical protein